MPKKEILRGRRSFQKVFEHGRFRRAKYLGGIYLPSQQTKVAFVVSRRVKGSVRRNRIRRRLREVYRLNRESLTRPGLLVLVGSSTTATAPFTELEEDFRRLMATLTKND